MGSVVTASAIPDDTIFTLLGKMLWVDPNFFLVWGGSVIRVGSGKQRESSSRPWMRARGTLVIPPNLFSMSSVVIRVYLGRWSSY